MEIETFKDAVIERIFANRSLKGRTYHVLQLQDGNRIFCFDDQMLEGLEEGTKATLEVKKRGDYLHLVKLYVNGQEIRGQNAERESIERQSAARTTAILLQSKQATTQEFKDWFKEILRLIRQGSQKTMKGGQG